MAQTSAAGISGLQIDVIDVAEDRADDLNLDPISAKILDAWKKYEIAKKANRAPRATASHLVAVINMIADEYGLTCGASE